MKKFLLNLALVLPFVVMSHSSFANEPVADGSIIFNMSKASVMQVTYTVSASNFRTGEMKFYDPVEVTINPKNGTNINYVKIPVPVIDEYSVSFRIDKVIIQNGASSSTHANACEGSSLNSTALFLDDSYDSSMLICTKGTVS